MSVQQLELVTEANRAKRGRRRIDAPRTFKVAGLFAGIGGLECGLSRAKHHTALLCEIDPAAGAVLDAHFPNIKKHKDVTTLKYLPRGTDLVVAGFPCQDLSQAGMTAGITGDRSGLVEHVFRLVAARPKKLVPWMLLENVPFMLQLGRGRALDVIIGAIEKLGYRWAYRVIDARAFGRPQRRERVFLVASLHDDPRDVLLASEAGEPPPQQAEGVACGFYWTEGLRGLGWAVNAVPTLKGGSTVGIPSPPAIVLPNGEIVTPNIRDAERLQGFRQNWTKPAESVVKKGHRWKLVGNAVNVDVSEWLGGMLARPGKYIPTGDRRIREGEPWPRAAWNVGDGRFASPVSAWPVRRKAKPLATFLKYPTASLSAKAIKGFLSRAHSSTLRFPPGFIETAEAHRRRMEEEKEAEKAAAA
jgi:DNA (cytosine-5)-methyltransferase 1